MSIVEVLRKAKELLKTHGRTQGENFSSDGRMCLHGALLVATGMNDPAGNLRFERPFRDRYWTAYTVREKTRMALADTRYAGYANGLPVDPIAFNDDQRVTDDMIFHLIDKTIERLESEA